MSAAVDAIAILDAEITILRDRLAAYRKKATLAAARKGERQITADRMCEWQEHRINQMLKARDNVAEMMRKFT